jgi:hypothetical protein
VIFARSGSNQMTRRKLQWRSPLRPEGSATRAWPPLLPRVPGDHCPLESAHVRPRPDGLSLSWSLNLCPERPARPWPSGCKLQARPCSGSDDAAWRTRGCLPRAAVVRAGCCISLLYTADTSMKIVGTKLVTTLSKSVGLGSSRSKWVRDLGSLSWVVCAERPRT